MSEAGAPYPTELTDKACTYNTVHRLYSTPRKKKKKKGGARDGLKRWKAAVGSEKKTERKGKETAGVCVVYWKDRWRCSEKNKHATVERLFHLEMKGVDGEQAISKGNIITFSYLLLEPCGGGRGRRGEEEGRGWWRRGAFKSNNPSLRYIHFFSHSPPHLVTFRPNLSISLYVPPFSTCGFFPLLSATLFFLHLFTSATPRPHPTRLLPFNVRKMTNSSTAPKMRRGGEKAREKEATEREKRKMSVIRGQQNGEQAKGKMPGSDTQGGKERKRACGGESPQHHFTPKLYFFWEKRWKVKRGCVYMLVLHISLSFFILARVEAESMREVSKKYSRDNRRFKVSSDS